MTSPLKLILGGLALMFLMGMSKAKEAAALAPEPVDTPNTVDIVVGNAYLVHPEGRKIIGLPDTKTNLWVVKSVMNDQVAIYSFDVDETVVMNKKFFTNIVTRFAAAKGKVL